MEWSDNYNDYDEVCVYCHTPHNSNTSAGAPLWNRTNPTSSYTLYAGSNLINQPGQPGPESLVCLSCHDGMVSVDAVLNAPGNSNWQGWENPAYPGNNPFHGRMQGSEAPDYNAWRDCGGCHGDNPIVNPILSRTFISTNLSDDHPVNITYPVGASGYKPVSNLDAEGVSLYQGKVECLSFHNVHDATYSPFLIKDNAGSSLCYICHSI